jgi:hypothetical protein
MNPARDAEAETEAETEADVMIADAIAIEVAVGVPVYYGMNEQMAFDMLDILRTRFQRRGRCLKRANKLLGDSLVREYELQMEKLRKETQTRVMGLIFRIGGSEWDCNSGPKLLSW